MARSVYEVDWDPGRQALWDNAVRRATFSKRGQSVLREIEAALLALPEKRLIDGLLCDGTGVCAIGALAAHRRVLDGMTWEQAFTDLDWSQSYDDEEDDVPSVDDTACYAQRGLSMAFSLAWDLAYDNDHLYGGLTPEERYEHILRWVRARLMPIRVVP